MKRAKKLLCLLLTLCMIVGMFPVTALAAGNLPFTDVKVTDWFYDEVQFVYENELMSGTGATTFSPNATTTRGMIVTILHRMEGVPLASGLEFDDVAEGQYYTDAVKWASENGIVGGYGNGKFGPNDPITREQMAAILYRYAQIYAYDTSVSGSIAAFADGDQVSTYAVEAMKWAVGMGFISGTTGNRLDPTGTATRAQIAAILSRFCEEYELFGAAFLPIVPNNNSLDDSECTVTFNSNGGSAVTSQTVKKGDCADEPEETTRAGYLFAGWHLEPNPQNILNPFDFSQTPIEKDIVLYAEWLSMTDTDADGLIDGVEKYYGTDINNADTDGDGLTDYVEVVVLGSNPLVAGNEVNEDYDGDTLSNLEEVKIGTDPSTPDTDADGLDDNRELEIGTDPVNYDTDGDGASDGVEVDLGTDPLSANSSFNYSLTADYAEDDSVTASVELTLAGEQLETLSINPIIDEMLFPKEMPGYLGHAYDFNVAGEFNSATISFEFDPSILEKGADPAIFYFNEETQDLEELNTTINGGTASTVVEHFSTYILLDRNIFYDSFTWSDIWDTESTYNNLEIVLVIDDSGSLGGDYEYDSSTGFFLGGNDPKHLRLTAARDFVDKSSATSQIGIVKFDSDVKTFADLTYCDDLGKSTLKSILQFERVSSSDVFNSRGKTSMYTGIDAAFDLFSGGEVGDGASRVVIVFTDGQAHDAEMHSGVISEALEKDIRIYTVGLGNSTDYFSAYLSPLAQQTGGEFFLASDADQLIDIYNDIRMEIDLSADADDDGVPDYYEENVIAFNGMKIKMDKNKKDTDGDGLLDNEEVEIELVHNPANKTKVLVKGKLHSYPHLTDSDNDSIHDRYDPNPMEFTITDRTLSWVAGLSYTNLNDFEGKTVGYAVEHGAAIEGISAYAVRYLRDAVIVQADDSGATWEDLIYGPNDKGLGYVALKIDRRIKSDAIIFALRGTEMDDDIVNDFVITDVALGLGYDSTQSKFAFEAYKEIATNHAYSHYITGHSLGGRLTQDVLYKTYKANSGGLFKKVKTYIPQPIHSATFNALGYNAVVKGTLHPGIMKNYENKLTNYWYRHDLIGEGFGCSGPYLRSGTDAQLVGKDIYGDALRANEQGIFKDLEYHGIEYFQFDYDLLYTTEDTPLGSNLANENRVIHYFSYWVD